MHAEKFRYIGIAHSQAGAGFVAFNLRRQEGTEFTVILRVDDAQDLLDDLVTQVRIAAPDQC